MGAIENAFKKAQEKTQEPQEATLQNETQDATEGNEVQEQEEVVQQQEANAQESGTEEEVLEQPAEPKEEEPAEQQEDGFSLEFSEEELKGEEASAPNPTYTALAEKLGVEDLSTEDDLVSYISELKAKAESPKVEFANEAIAKANEIAAQGGNWEEYLGLHSIDYSTLSDKEAGVAALRNRGFDDERIEGLLDTDAGLTMIESEGKRAKQDAESRRKQKLNEYEAMKQKQEQELAQQQEQQRKAQKALHDDLRSELSKRAKDGFEGIKIPETYAQRLEKEITTGNGVMSLFTDEQGRPDPSKIVDTYMRAKLFDKVVSRAKTVSKTEGKREVMKNLHNTDLSGKPGVEPKEQVEKEGRKWAKQLASAANRNPFATKKE